jgi:F0F1-type ATP synthase membrane subunit b/b'
MQQAEEQIERAHHEIEAARQQAITEIYAVTGNLATSIAEKILRRNLNPDDQRDLVNQSLEQLQKIGAN